MYTQHTYDGLIAVGVEVLEGPVVLLSEGLEDEFQQLRLVQSLALVSHAALIDLLTTLDQCVREGLGGTVPGANVVLDFDWSTFLFCEISSLGHHLSGTCQS